MRVRAAPLTAVIATLAINGSARAQAVAGAGVSVEANTDDRRRGLSWSDGRPSLAASAYVPVTDALELNAALSALRGSVRHGGEAVGIDLGARYRHELAAGWRLSVGVTGHMFVDASQLNYAEGEARISYSIGPASVETGASYAPRQSALGGDNLYLLAGVVLTVPRSPWAVRGGVGHSSGAVQDMARAARLRPNGRYWDYALAIEHVRDRWTAGARFTATSTGSAIPRSPYDDRHSGATVAAYLRLDI